MTPRPPALDTAAARRPPDVRAMPARRIGCWMPRRAVRGVVMGPVGAISVFVVCSGDELIDGVSAWSAGGAKLKK